MKDQAPVGIVAEMNSLRAERSDYKGRTKAITTALKAKQRQWNKFQKHLRSLSDEDLRNMLEIRVAKPKPKARPKARARA